MFDVFKLEITDAVYKYSKDNVDVVVDELTGDIYGMFHSRHDSFPVTKRYPVDMVSTKEIIRFCNDIGIGYCI